MSDILKKILHFEIFKHKINYSKLNPHNFTWSGFKSFLKGLGVSVIFLGALIIVKDEVNYQLDLLGISDNSSSEETITEDDQAQEENCNVSGIELHGSIDTYISYNNSDPDATEAIDATASEDVVGAINQAEKDEKIKAIILEIDSYGGYPVAAEEMAQAMKRATKPTVAMIRKAGISAAYWSATGANIIFASANSDVGGIGVTNSYLDNSKKNAKDGLTYNSLSTGMFKDTQDPDKALTEAERNLIMRDAYIINDNFIKTVATNRNLDPNKVRALADGSSMLGEAALKIGLIDKIGGIAEVKDYLKEKVGEDIQICW
ncbi:S49 family peptidase [Candidatus Falkowbacteria bacterium]|nr:MAG: S49 family peptidase [Candidatus Falkowbacteria bacterium]